MIKNAKWIWVDKKRYPQMQRSSVSVFSADKKKYYFGVIGFKKEFSFEKVIRKAEISVFGDCRFYLWVNNKFVGRGPVCVGGDVKMPCQYYNTYIEEVNHPFIDFYVTVQNTPVQENDNSSGRGGFILSAKLTFEDGSETFVSTDKNWLSRKENEYLSPWTMDYTKDKDLWQNAVEIESVWNIVPSEIKNLRQEIVSSEVFEIEPKSNARFHIELDKIYSAYSVLDICASGDYKIELTTAEIPGRSLKTHTIWGNKSENYRSNEYFSVGEYELEVENKSDEIIKIRSNLVFVCYPSKAAGYFKCSDDLLNRIYELGRWTIQICRQDIELDSPVHQENLLCIGDYMIESLVNNYTTGDYSLTRFDLLRASRYYEATEGYTYNDNYCLVWYQWLWDYYCYSGDKDFLLQILGGLEAVLTRQGYMESKEGLIENVNGYSFIDWSYIDGYSMGHPPKSLGQTYYNILYCNALKIASKVYKVLGIDDKQKEYENKARNLKSAINNRFFDEEKGLYCDGELGHTPSNGWMPQNTENKYYTVYANTFAVFCDICDKRTGKEIMKKIMSSDTIDVAQAYFLHYVLEALYKTGLYDEYGFKLISKWKQMLDTCEKGMHEVLCYKDGYDGFNTDFSHAWGATPTYQLPSKISGVKFIKEGWKEIELEPNLFGLEWVELSVPTPYGIIDLKIDEKNKSITIPDRIILHNRKELESKGYIISITE